VFDLVFGSVGAAIALVLLTGTIALGQSNKPQPHNQPVGDLGEGAVARGKYIVERVDMCGQCHTPRDIDIDDRWKSRAGSMVAGRACPLATYEARLQLANHCAAYWTDSVARQR
jgi:hypothetical protein